MPDEIDMAAEREAQLRADALSAHARSVGTHGAESATTCCECGEPIPAGRRAAVPGVQTCIACQLDIERLSRSRQPR
ncbi:MAG: TraR/DksA C4-type zinc finger protein [Burkholderia sp.]